MNNNATYTISEYETLISKCDDMISKLNEQVEKNKEKYCYSVKVDIKI